MLSGLVMAACGGAPDGGASTEKAGTTVTGAEATGVATEAYRKPDPCAPICNNPDDPYAAENCVCYHKPHPITCYQ